MPNYEPPLFFSHKFVCWMNFMINYIEDFDLLFGTRERKLVWINLLLVLEMKLCHCQS